MNYYERSLDALMHAHGRYDVTFGSWRWNSSL